EGDLDGDGRFNYIDPDLDGDGFVEIIEDNNIDRDFDHDGDDIQYNKDLDRDNDGICDLLNIDANHTRLSLNNLSDDILKIDVVFNESLAYNFNRDNEDYDLYSFNDMNNITNNVVFILANGKEFGFENNKPNSSMNTTPVEYGKFRKTFLPNDTWSGELDILETIKKKYSELSDNEIDLRKKEFIDYISGRFRIKITGFRDMTNQPIGADQNWNFGDPDPEIYYDLIIPFIEVPQRTEEKNSSNSNTNSEIRFIKGKFGPLLSGNINICVPYYPPSCDKTKITSCKLEIIDSSGTPIEEIEISTVTNKENDDRYQFMVDFNNSKFKEGDYNIVIKFYQDGKWIITKEGIKRTICIDRQSSRKGENPTNVSQTNGNHSVNFIIDDTINGIGLKSNYDEDFQRFDEEGIFGAYFYDLSGKRVDFDLELLGEYYGTEYPNKIACRFAHTDHSSGDPNCPLLEADYHPIYVYATDLAGNMTTTHPDYVASTRSGLYSTSRSLIDYCVGYIYTESYPDENECFADPPDDVDIYGNVYYEESTGKISSTSDGLDTFTKSENIANDKSSMFPYDYYRPTYEGYLKGHEAGVFLAGTYPALDVMVTNLLNPTQLVHSKVWNPDEYLREYKTVILPSGSLIGRGEDNDIISKNE
ncbi:MAG: hypothetical protein PHV06_10540, partial [bacterium]|nr:hypothetical protein [bacterium]